MPRRPPRPREAGVIGIDLSLRRAAAVFLPAGWCPGTWDGVAWATTGAEVAGRDERLCAERLVKIANDLFMFLHSHAADHVFMEDYAYGLAGHAGMALAEAGGAVKLTFAEDDVVIRSVNQSTARALFLGKLPKDKRAQVTHAAIQRLEPPWGRGSDEGDALVVANLGRSLLGLPAMTLGG